MFFPVISFLDIYFKFSMNTFDTRVGTNTSLTLYLVILSFSPKKIKDEEIVYVFNTIFKGLVAYSIEISLFGRGRTIGGSITMDITAKEAVSLRQNFLPVSFAAPTLLSRDVES